MALRADLCRCHGTDCPERDQCARFVDLRNGVNEFTPYMACSITVAEGRYCIDRLPVAPSESAP